MRRHFHSSHPNPNVGRDPLSTSSTLAYADIVNQGALADSNGLDGMPAQGATLKNLCEEDKQKVARLIRQVVSVTKEKEAVQRQAAQERASQQAALEGLQAQNCDLLAELTALRLKLLQADGLLRSYQLKLRALKGGAFREAALLPDSPTLGQPAQAEAATQPRPTFPNSRNAQGASSSASTGAHLTPTTPSNSVQAEPSQGRRLVASPSPPALDSGHRAPATSTGPAVPGVLEATRASSEQRLGSPPAGAAAVPAEGVWAAWVELEQRIRAISGKLAQRGGQHGEDAAGVDVGERQGRRQGGNAAGRTAAVEVAGRPMSASLGHAGQVWERPPEGNDLLTSADVHSTAIACFQEDPNGKPSKHTGAGLPVPSAPGSALAVDPPGRREECPGSQTEPVRLTSPHQRLVGGPVSQPRPVFFAPKEAPLPYPPSYPQQAGAVLDPPPPAVMPTAGVLHVVVPPAVPSPPAIAGPAPLPAPSLPPVSPTSERSAVQAPVGTALASGDCPGSPCAAACAPLLVLKSGHPAGAPDGCQGVHPGAMPSGDSPLDSGWAAEVRYDVAGPDQGRGLEGARLDAPAGPVGVRDAAEVSGMPGRGEAARERVLRFDPTVGEAGAFYYVDVFTDEKGRAGRAGDGTSGEPGGQRRRGGEDSDDVPRRARVSSPLGGTVQGVRRRAAGEAEVETIAPSSLPKKAVTEGMPVAGLPLALVTAAPRVAQRVVVKESGGQDRCASPEESRSRGGGQGRARWVSGMLYDSALLELVEELEMDHPRTGRPDPGGELPAEWTAWARRMEREETPRKWNGASQPVPSVNGRRQVQARGRRERHPHFAQSKLEPEVLVLTNGW